MKTKLLDTLGDFVCSTTAALHHVTLIDDVQLHVLHDRQNIAILKSFIWEPLDESGQITFIFDRKYQLSFVNVRPLFLVRRWYRPWQF